MRRATAMALLLVLFSGLASYTGSTASAGVPSGCLQVVHDIDGRILPESSGLSCRQIKELVTAVPAESGGFSIIRKSVVRGIWSCHLFVPAQDGVLLRCRHHQDRFSIVKR